MGHRLASDPTWALAGLALVFLAGTAGAASTAVPPTENGIYIAHGICFGEGGCPWVNWRARTRVEIRERIDPSSPAVATLKPGDWVQAVEGQYRLVPRRGVVRTAHQNLAAGDVIYQLEPLGEGETALWRRGQLLTLSPPMSPEEEDFVAWDALADVKGVLGWWVRVKLSNGKTGWVEKPDFECMGPLAGDENCRN